MQIRRLQDQTRTLLIAFGGLLGLDTLLRLLLISVPPSGSLPLPGGALTLHASSLIPDIAQQPLYALLMGALMLLIAAVCVHLDGRLSLTGSTPGRPAIAVAAGLAGLVFFVLIPDLTPVSLHLDTGRSELPVNWPLPLAWLVYAALMLLIGNLRPRRKASGASFRLKEVPPLDLDLSALKRGTDNVRIDVFLGSSFLSLVSRFLESVTQREFELRRKHKAPAIARGLMDEFIETYITLMSNAIQQARQQHNPHIARLARLAITRCLIERADNAYEKVLVELRDRSTSGRHRAVVSLDAHVYLVWVSSHKTEIIAAVLSKAFAELRKADARTTSPLFESLTGRHEVLDEQLIYNLMMASPSPCDDRYLGPRYFLFGHRKGDRFSFIFLARMLEEIVRVHTSITAPSEIAPARGISPSTLLGPHWADLEENIDILFNTTGESHGGHPLSRHMLRIYREVLKDAGILKLVVSTYFISQLPAMYNMVVSPQFLQQYLSGTLPLRTLLNELPAGRPVSYREQLQQELLSLRRKVNDATRHSPDRYVLRLLKDICRYRSGLRYYQIIRGLLQQINMPEDADALRLSRANHVLYDFSMTSETEIGEHASHVVLKTDIRGSTTLIRLMQDKGLNPATYFSEYFFNPIEGLLTTYGARKIFVEGDAIILATSGNGDFPVARACGLAVSISEMITRLNAAARHYELPALEMGTGIAFSQDPPTYLFDGDRTITISNAIGDADRLSSCAWQLREMETELEITPFRVAVFAIDADNSSLSYKGQNVARYNVNGIQLDPTAFEQLAGEVALEERDATIIPDARADDRFYAASFIDALGGKRQLLIRRGQVRPIPGSPPASVTAPETYFEVIADSTLAQQVQTAARRSM